jgi:hypothetical protein
MGVLSTIRDIFRLLLSDRATLVIVQPATVVRA